MRRASASRCRAGVVVANLAETEAPLDTVVATPVALAEIALGSIEVVLLAGNADCWGDSDSAKGIALKLDPEAERDVGPLLWVVLDFEQFSCHLRGCSKATAVSATHFRRYRPVSQGH